MALARLPACTPELNPVELLWSAIKTGEPAKLAEVADAAERGIHRVCSGGQLR